LGRETVLERLDDVDWASATHAYGEASDVPVQIRDLLSPLDARRREALDGLFSNVWHQGTIYPATVLALPFLIELLQSQETPDRESIGLLVASILAGQGYWEVHSTVVKPPVDLAERLEDEAAVVARVREIGSQAIPLILPYLTHNHPDFRSTAFAALAPYAPRSAALSAALDRARLDEQDEHAREIMEEAAHLEALPV
jgi:hypothetical protein